MFIDLNEMHVDVLKRVNCSQARPWVYGKRGSSVYNQPGISGMISEKVTVKQDSLKEEDRACVVKRVVNRFTPDTIRNFSVFPPAIRIRFTCRC